MKLQIKFSKFFYFLFFGVAITFISCTNDENNSNNFSNQNNKISTLNSFNDSVSYSLGVVVGNQMKNYGIKKIDYQRFIEGIQQSLSNKNIALSAEVAQQIVNTYVQRTLAKEIYQNQTIKEDFFSKNALKQGVENLPNGIQYKIIKQGNGKIPTLNNSVTIYFKGQLVDGTVFSNNFGQNPAKFIVRNSLKGWQETLTLMKQGSVWEIYLPPQYAFGDKGNNKIPPNSIVIYTIELIKVE